MRISAMIARLQTLQEKVGDIELFSEYNDGRVTWAEPTNLNITNREIWPGHSAGRKNFVTV